MLMQGFTNDCVVLLHYVFGFVPAVFFIADALFHFVLLAGRCALGGLAHLSPRPRAVGRTFPTLTTTTTTTIN
jgi:hypothetical protein